MKKIVGLFFIVIVFGVLGISFIDITIFQRINSDFLPYEKVYSIRFERLVYFFKMKLCIVSLFLSIIFSMIYLLYDTFVAYIKRSFSLVEEDIVNVKRDLYVFGKSLVLKDILFFLIILFLYVFVRIMVFGKHLAYDEAYTFYHYAVKPIYYALTSYTLPNNHFFNTLMIHLFFKVFGYSMFSIKLPAFIFSIILFFGTFFVFSSLYNKYVAFLSLIFMTFSPDMVVFSTLGRGYIFSITFGVFSLYFLEKFMKGEIESPVWYALFMSLAIYSLPSFVVIFVGYHLFSLVVYKDWRKDTQLVLWTILFTGILFLPVYIVSGFDMVSVHTSSQIMGFKHIDKLLPYLYRIFTYISYNFYMPALVFLFVFVLSLLYLRDKESVIVLSILFSFVGIIVINRVKLFPYRTILIFLPYFYLLFSRLIFKLFHMKQRLILFFLLLFLGISFFRLPYNVRIKSHLYDFEVGINDIKRAIDLSITEGVKLFAWGEESAQFIGRVFYGRDDIPSLSPPNIGDIVFFGTNYEDKVEKILRRYDKSIMSVQTDTVFSNEYVIITQIKNINR